MMQNEKKNFVSEDIRRHRMQNYKCYKVFKKKNYTYIYLYIYKDACEKREKATRGYDL